MPAFACRQYYTIKCVHRPIFESTSGLSVICNEAVAVFVQAKPDVTLAALHIGKRRFSWAECTSLAFLLPQRLMVETILSGVVIWVSLNLPFLFWRCLRFERWSSPRAFSSCHKTTSDFRLEDSKRYGFGSTMELLLVPAI